MTDASGPAGALAGADNLRRQMGRLRRHAGAMGALARLGVGAGLVERFSLGIKEPYRARGSGLVTENALAYPIHARAGGPIGRFAYLNVAGVTANPGRPDAWGPGEALPYFSRAAVGADDLVVVSDPVTMWLMAGRLDDADGRRTVIVTRSHFEGLPFDFSSSSFWAQWGKVTLALDGDGQSAALAELALSSAGREVLAASPPGDGSWADLVRSGASAHELRAIFDRARLAGAPARLSPPADPAVGSFAARPVDVMGAFVDGRLYYAAQVERRSALGRAGVADCDVLQEYVTVVVRGDGELLEAVTLPAPRGTPAHRRVLALTDGTRINPLPTPTFTSWSFASMEAFVRARRDGRDPSARPLGRIVADIEAYVRSVVWLPDGEAYLLIALYIVASHCCRVFAAVPLLLVQGAKGSGKSELGQVIADLAFNGVVVGATTAAAFVRLIDETRGLLVLDDAERISGVAGGFGDVSQILKASYKAGTARKAVADRSGRVIVKDFFGCKVVTNITGAADALRSRMLRVATRTAPLDVADGLVGLDHDRAAAIRDELHVWAMCSVGDVATAYAEMVATRARGRRDEIEAPLRALASMCGDASMVERLERVLARQDDDGRVEPDALVAGAAAALVRRIPSGRVSLAQLALEARLRAGGAEVPASTLDSPEWLGRALLRLGLRDPSVEATRHRLRGRIVRVVTLRKVADAGSAAISGDGENNFGTSEASGSDALEDPLAFCAEAPCGTCGYRQVCPLAVAA